jgi:GTP-binding protein
MFVDEVQVIARAGHGGKGCVAFHRETFCPKGGPSGGNGGHGGHVILEGDRDLNNLVAQYYTSRLFAERGHPGLGKGMDGRAGKDLVVHVPCGTLVWRLAEPVTAEAQAPGNESAGRVAGSGTNRPRVRFSGDAQAIEFGETEPRHQHSEAAQSDGSGEARELVADLTEHGQQFVLCHGGRGGLGNRNFATARRQAPRFAQPGEPGDEGRFILELRLIADVGLVGYPNAGKSTLLTAISRARPRIASYPFTTLHPQIGIVEYPDWHRVTVCDVPGLIEGAHRNVGLGHEFLRHIQRCRVLVLLLDMAGTDNREPVNDYRLLLAELELYDPCLLEKARLVVANKMDEPAAEAHLRRFKRRVPGVRVLRMAAAFGEGIEAFKTAMRRTLTDVAASTSHA